MKRRTTSLRTEQNHHQFHLAIEGIDGTGKSSAINNVEQILANSGLSVAVVRYTNKEGRLGRLIRSVYHQEQNSRIMSAVTSYRPLQAAMYATNGRLNLFSAPKDTDVLLADRSVMSGYASHIGRVPTWFLSTIESLKVPDVVAYLDLPIDEATKRVGIREHGSVGFEEDETSMQRFQDDYEAVMANMPRRLRNTEIERVDARANQQELAHTIAGIVFRHLSINQQDLP